jgi:hypothetical protein
MGGYFTDGEVNIELGEHVFATPSVRRSSSILVPHGRPGVLLDRGGGVIELQVTGQRLRYSLGDAERYVYELFRSLALSGAGDVGIEDELGNRTVLGGCLCVGATAEVRALRFVEMKFTFAMPEQASEPAWSGIPAPPAEYPGTGSAQDYAAGGVAIGEHPLGLRIEMMRECRVRPLPRSRGGRAAAVVRGAAIAFTVQAHTTATGAQLAGHLAQLARSIGPRPVILCGNGNSFEGAVLDTVEPAHADGRHTRVEVRFLLPVDADAPTTPGPTTTPEATTTSAGVCPDEAYCTGHCADYYHCGDVAGALCGGGAACSGSITWIRSGSDACRWVLYSPAGCCSASAIQCASGAWSFTVTHNVAGKTAVYGKPNASGGCPSGVYSRIGGTCPDAPQTVTVYSQ